jgi:glutamate-1-semialdehyde 2,1-aminomutase
MRNKEPENNFLQKVRDLATKRNIVLIFDECTSGFRETFGGLHLKYNIQPDIAVFGKALGNGYPITAIIGRRQIMEAAQSTFISSTFWTDRIGPTAALKTLEIMEKEKSWEKITTLGLRMRHCLQSISKKYDIKLDYQGIPALTGFTFKNEKSLHYKTLITQEMLKKGLLAGTSCYLSIKHTAKIIDRFFYELDPIFGLIKECEQGRDVNLLLDGPVCDSGFKRLN